MQQAASMHRQHERFLEIHEEDDFVREYMEAIGHHEFGKGLKPVDVNGWLEEAPESSELKFWVWYWTEAYQFALEQAGEEVAFISYARITEEPESTLGRLADRLEIPAEELVPMADRLRPPRTHAVNEDSLPRTLLEKARKIYQRLDRKSSI